MRNVFIVSCILGLSALGACAKVVVVKVDGTTKADGVLYALPRTVVRLQIKLDKQSARSGNTLPSRRSSRPGERWCAKTRSARRRRHCRTPCSPRQR
jgi:hypothetical protein